LATSDSTSRGGSPRAARRALRASTSCRTSAASSRSGGRGHERAQLRLDVDRRLAARGASGVASLQQSAYFIVARHRRRGPIRPGHRPVAADPVIRARARRQCDHRGEQREHRDADHHREERSVHRRPMIVDSVPN